MTMDHDYVCAYVHPQHGRKRGSKVRFAKRVRNTRPNVFLVKVDLNCRQVWIADSNPWWPITHDDPLTLTRDDHNPMIGSRVFTKCSKSASKVCFTKYV